MKTSYYAKFSRLKAEEKEKYLPIAISLSIPHWFKECDIQITNLAPTPQSFKKHRAKAITEEEFISEYIDTISNWIDLKGIIDYIHQLEETYNKEAVLLCYEVSDNFCHRHILRNFLNNRWQLDIEEL